LTFKKRKFIIYLSIKERSGSAMDYKEKYLDVAGLMSYLKVGRNKAMQIGEESGAKVKIGRRNLYIISKIDAYIMKKGE
jgi:hypothetical protein